MKLCVVFDLDETLIHFIDERNKHVWENTSEKNKNAMDYVEEEDGVFIFRPFIKEMFSYFLKNRTTISVGIWTYADATYAAKVREVISKRCNLPEDFFLFTYSFDDISGPYPKDIRYVFRHFPECNKSNTFLVDNLASNVMHKINKKNGILIPSFAPYGHNPNWNPALEEIRNPATSVEHTKARKDDCLRDIVKICQKALKRNQHQTKNTKRGTRRKTRKS